MAYSRPVSRWLPVLKAVTFGPSAPETVVARRLGAGYLVSHARLDGSVDEGPFGMVYPVHTASAAAIALSQPGLARYSRARNAWVRELRRR